MRGKLAQRDRTGEDETSTAKYVLVGVEAKECVSNDEM